MSILKKPYEISVWEDEWVSSADNGKGKFVEKRIGVIGTDNMLYQGRAIEPNLTRNVNGVKKFSFKMYKRFVDNMTGEEVDNPFSDWLISERKVKLEYDGKWYDFIVKDIVENSSNYLYTYQLEDMLVQELSKNGFNVVLDEKIRDEKGKSNMGTIKELAEKVLLAETDWKVDSEVFVEKVKENLVYLKIQKDLEVKQIIDQSDLKKGLQIKDPIIIKSGAEILGFYSSCTSKPHRFQFIYLSDGYEKNKVKIDEDQIIVNDNCQYYIDIENIDGYAQWENTQYFLPTDISLSKKTSSIDNDTDSTVSVWYRGARYGFAMQAEYVSLLDRYCNKYIKDGKEYYGFVDNNYISPNMVQDVITNPNFNGTAGWTGSYIGDASKERKTYGTVIESVFGQIDTAQGKFTSVVELIEQGKFNETVAKQCNSYLKVITRTSGEDIGAWKNHSIIINSGFYDNRTITGSVKYGELWPFSLQIYSTNLTGTVTNNANSLFKPYLAEVEYDAINDKYNIKEVWAEYFYDEQGYLKFYTKEQANEDVKIGSKTIKKADVEISKADFKQKNICLILVYDFDSTVQFTSDKYYTYYIKNISLYRGIKNSKNKWIKPGGLDQEGVIQTEYKFFAKTNLDKAKTKEEIIFEIKDKPSYGEYVPVYYIEDDRIGDKVRSVSAKESNYFNILQSIAETFEAWLDLSIGRDNLGAITDKTVVFKNYVGDNNYASFRYGVNLKDISRTYASKNIVNKLIVKTNANEYGENGFCTIQRANANPTGENYIYDFRYYHDKDLMNKNDYLSINYYLSDAKGPDSKLWTKGEVSNGEPKDCNLNGYFPRIKQINTAILPLNKTITTLETDLVKLRAEKEVQENIQKATQSSLEEIQQDFFSFSGVDIGNCSPVSYNNITCEIPGRDSKNDTTGQKGVNLLNTSEWAKNTSIYCNGVVDDKTNKFNFTAELKFNNALSEVQKTNVSTWGGSEVVKDDENNLTIPSSNKSYSGLKIGIDEGYTEGVWYQLYYSIENPQGTELSASLKAIGGHKPFNNYKILVGYYKVEGGTETYKGEEYKRGTDKNPDIIELNWEKYSECNKIKVWVQGTFAPHAEDTTNNSGAFFIQPNRGQEVSEKQTYKISAIEVRKWKPFNQRTIYFQPTVTYKYIDGGKTTKLLKTYPIHNCTFEESMVNTFNVEFSPVDFSNSKIQEMLTKYSTYLTELQNATDKLEGNKDKVIVGLNDSIADKEKDLKDSKAQQSEYSNFKKLLNSLFYEKYSRFIQEGTWVDEKYYDDDKYYFDAQTVMYNSSYPQVAYSINVLELSQLPGYELFKFNLGDKTYVEDPDFFGVDKKEEIIITEMSESLDNPSKNVIKVQNFKNQFQDLFQKITATVQQTQYREGTFKKSEALAEANAQKKFEFLSDGLTEMSNSLNLAGQTTVTQGPDGITLVDSNTQNKLRLIGGAILMGTKDKNGAEVWKTGLTPEGISANRVVAGTINTGIINIKNGNDSTFVLDSFGLSAYDTPWGEAGVIGTPNFNQFVRFDKYGIYGISREADVKGTEWRPTGNGFDNDPLKEINAKATFALTWDGLKVTGNDAVLRIGKLDDYILKVNNGSYDTFSVDGDGNTTIRGNLLLGDGKSVKDEITRVQETADDKMPPKKVGGDYTWEFDQENGITMDYSGKDSSITKHLFQLTEGSLWMNGTGEFTGAIYATAGQIGPMAIGDVTSSLDENLVLLTDGEISNNNYPCLSKSLNNAHSFQENEEYYISFYATPKREVGKATITKIGVYNSGGTVELKTFNVSPDDLNKEKLYSGSFKWRNNTTNGNTHVNIYFMSENGITDKDNMPISSIKKLKISKASTSWSASPLDSQYIGKNLLLNTNETVFNEKYPIVVKELSKEIIYNDGEDYTISFFAKVGRSSEDQRIINQISVYNTDGHINLCNISVDENSIGKYTKYSSTFKWKHHRNESGAVDSTTLRFYFMNDELGSNSAGKIPKSSIEKIKLEKGTMATEWSEHDKNSINMSANYNNFSWLFSPSTGITMWNGEQASSNTVFQVNEKGLYISGSIDCDGDATFSGNVADNYLEDLVLKAGDNFGVNKDGVVYCNDLQATGGDIAGFNIKANAIAKDAYGKKDGKYNQARVFIQSPKNSDENDSFNGNAFAVYARELTDDSPKDNFDYITDSNNLKFGVRYNGEVVCKNLNATGGNIGSWEITEEGYLKLSDTCTDLDQIYNQNNIILTNSKVEDFQHSLITKFRNYFIDTPKTEEGLLGFKSENPKIKNIYLQSRLSVLGPISALVWEYEDYLRNSQGVKCKLFSVQVEMSSFQSKVRLIAQHEGNDNDIPSGLYGDELMELFDLYKILTST